MNLETRGSARDIIRNKKAAPEEQQTANVQNKEISRAWLRLLGDVGDEREDHEGDKARGATRHHDGVTESRKTLTNLDGRSGEVIEQAEAGHCRESDEGVSEQSVQEISQLLEGVHVHVNHLLSLNCN